MFDEKYEEDEVLGAESMSILGVEGLNEPAGSLVRDRGSAFIELVGDPGERTSRRLLGADIGGDDVIVDPPNLPISDGCAEPDAVSELNAVVSGPFGGEFPSPNNERIDVDILSLIFFPFL